MFFCFLDFLEFLQFRAFFFLTLPESGFFFGMRSFLFVFGLRGGGGGFSQDFWIFWIFWNFRSSELFFFGLLFCFLDFLEFLQFRAVFFQNLTRTRAFFGMRSFLLFLAFEEGGWFLPGLLDFLEFPQF